MTSPAVNQAIEELAATNAQVSHVSLETRVQICRECLVGVSEMAEEWSQQAAVAKQCPKVPGVLAEDLLSGPIVVARQLQLTIQTLVSIANGTSLRRPRCIQRISSEQVAVSVFPAEGLFDRLTFMGVKGWVHMQPGIRENEIHGPRIGIARDGRLSGISAVLGAGNVSSIPATDSLNRIMFEGRQVVLKMNPVNDYLAPIFERAFAALIRHGLLRIITGDAATGKDLVNHPGIADVHVTGSTETHDAIVWGPDKQDRERRRQSNTPVIQKPVTSELGNVSPWIIAPGHYSPTQLNSQAQHIAASITNNASFNCLATKVIVTWKNWSQRDEFLGLVKSHLDRTPLRPAYYPGASERFHRFSATLASPDESNRLPWTLLTGQTIAQRPELFTEESFVCVCAETMLDSDSPQSFLERATSFVNDQMTGTLCASVTFPPSFDRDNPGARERCLAALRYGSVCVNQWSGLAYALTTPPWGAYPGATLANVESGIGSVHNTFLLDQHQKTVLEGPLVSFPKPLWFPSNRNSMEVARRLLSLYTQPSITRLPTLFAAALMG